MPRGDFDAFCEEHDADIEKLVETFADYEPVHGVNRPHFLNWLRQFKAQHRQLGLRLAKNICYYSTSKINGLMRQLHELIQQQVTQHDAGPSQVFYVPFGRSGESGEDILRRYRNVNRLHKRQSQFVSTIELPDLIHCHPSPLIFFLDDFIGTGKQVTDGWRESISQIVPEYVPVYFAVVAAFTEGARKVEKETPMHVISVHTVGTRHQLLESAFKALSSGDKSAIKTYCDDAGNQPLGYGGRGLLVSFAYGTPNNTISVIRGSERQKPWKGLLPDWEDL